jgi:hypothetical protein
MLDMCFSPTDLANYEDVVAAAEEFLPSMFIGVIYSHKRSTLAFWNNSEYSI